MFETPGTANAPDPGNSPEEGSGSNLKKLLLAFTVIMVLAVVIRVGLLMKSRHDEATVKPDDGPSHHLTQDDYIVPRKMYPNSLADARTLDGKRVWAFAAGQMDSYPATPSHVDFSHSAGLLLGAEPLDVTSFIEQVAPAKLYTRGPRGDAQVLMLFHKPSEPGKLFGTAVGYREGKNYTFYLDEAYFYDDPHVLYKHWPAEIWHSIDTHQPIAGMNELQAQLALGQVSKPGEGAVNNRTVIYDNNGHPVTITFEHGKATKITKG